MTDWSPSQYLKFADERTRAARDLLARVPLVAPSRVYDLGCGPGNSTVLLADAYPSARITGIDNSPAMIQAARAALPGVDFALADVSGWIPDDAPDLLFSNATFQWVPNHLGVIERLLRKLTKGAVIAVQMPDNLMEPSHRLMAEVAEQGPWAAKLKAVAAARAVLPAARDYYGRLRPHCTQFDIWHTAYNHALDGVAGIVEWVKSTGLRPFLNPLDEDERLGFLAAYQARLAEAYPPNADGTVLLRFPRLFMVAVK